ncbi:PREDICTED: uncharacterized protein LOC105559856, partial [Vollenhovia emeryi]|uniref:uncharacterized protein LOC105559856 n=1 Tax=Vollenhovia emeryi TaxID=411798 RepID=UPI0005F49804
KPLTNLLKKDIDFNWGNKEQESFDTLRNALCQEPILQYPDFTKPFLLTTDASGTAIGAILSQGKIGKDQPISYASRVLNDAERNYSTIEKELLAIVYAVQHFRPYLYGKKFTLVTDHKPLTWLHKLKDPTSRLARWRIKLAEYDYEIIYKPGKINANADALSRNPTTGIYPINIDYDEIEECSEDDEARERNAHPRPLPKSPRSGIMKEEEEPILTSGPRTRGMEKTEGESIPFTKKELEEPPFIKHTIQAEIHQEPKILPLELEETLNSANNASEGEFENLSDNINLPAPHVTIPPHLLQIINTLAQNHEDDFDYRNEKEDDETEEDEEEKTEEEEDNDSIADVDATYNEFDADKREDRPEDHIVTRGQKHSVINSRDKIFMRKENYLYFLTAD